VSDGQALASVTIRAASAADYPALRTAAGLCGPAAQEGLPDVAAFAARAPDSPVLVALSDEAIVGYLLASPLAYDGDAPVSLWIEGLTVIPGWRRRGLAIALCAALADGARPIGVRALLTSPPVDPALAALLARIGFVAHRDGVLLWRLEGS
jgi:GNAT superfamily N-acetyltransferase